MLYVNRKGNLALQILQNNNKLVMNQYKRMHPTKQMEEQKENIKLIFMKEITKMFLFKKFQSDEGPCSNSSKWMLTSFIPGVNTAMEKR